MKYKSKKDPDIIAAFDFDNEKFKTTTLIYLTGPKKGYSFTINNCTLRKYWEPVEDIPKPLNFTPEQMEQINQPYKPDVTPHYIPKPQSVIEYEENKHKSRRNNELPTFEEIADMFGVVLKKINEKSNYVVFKDGSAMHRKSAFIKFNTVENIWTQLAEKGLESQSNPDKDRPFAFTIKTKEDFDTVAEVILKTLKTKN